MWFFFALFAAILWGLNYALVQKILIKISPVTLLSLEMCVGAMLFTIISFFSTMKEDIRILSTNFNLLYLTMLEILIVLLASYLISFSISLKNATIVGLIELIYPFFIVFFSWILFKENQLSPSVIMGGFFILIGVAIIIFTGS